MTEPAARRLIYRHHILSRQGSPKDQSTPADFNLAWTGSIEKLDQAESPLAYCADFSAERVLFTLHRQVELGGLFEAPFLFMAQLRSAYGVVSVPFEQLGEVASPDPELRPVFVFSPGRTGSTLLMRLVAAVGLACASEPDMLTQVASMGSERRRRFPACSETMLAGACVASLGRVLGPGLFIKLRSQCNERPLAMVQASPGCRVVFMLRGARSWALSRHRAFGEGAEAAAAVLRQAFDALDRLAGAGIGFDVLWYETLRSDPAAALQVCAPHTAPDPALLSQALTMDSQEGTSVARDVVASRPVQDRFPAAFEAAWADACDGAVWTAPTYALLSQMWDS